MWCAVAPKRFSIAFFRLGQLRTVEERKSEEKKASTIDVCALGSSLVRADHRRNYILFLFSFPVTKNGGQKVYFYITKKESEREGESERGSKEWTLNWSAGCDCAETMKAYLFTNVIGVQTKAEICVTKKEKRMHCIAAILSRTEIVFVRLFAVRIDDARMKIAEWSVERSAARERQRSQPVGRTQTHHR